MVIFAGKLVQTPVGSLRLVPLRVNSMLVPRCMPRGTATFKTGAAGLGGVGGSCCPTPGTAQERIDSKLNDICSAKNKRSDKFIYHLTEAG